MLKKRKNGQNYFSDLRFLFDWPLAETRILYGSVLLRMVQEGEVWSLELEEDGGGCGGKILQLLGETPARLRIWRISTFGYLVPSPDVPATYGIFSKLPDLDSGKGEGNCALKKDIKKKKLKKHFFFIFF